MESYGHELLLDNISGIPLFIQHGSADDNVPVFHSRRMKQLISLKGPQSGLSKYVELAGKGHWFKEVMTTPQLVQFYGDVLNQPRVRKGPPPEFVLVVANPADMGPKHGIVVDQKSRPDQLACVHVRSGDVDCEIRTSNVIRFHAQAGLENFASRSVSLDGTIIDLPPEGDHTELGFVRFEDGTWKVCPALALENSADGSSFLLTMLGKTLRKDMDLSLEAWRPSYAVTGHSEYG